jgi:hypothetical protein
MPEGFEDGLENRAESAPDEELLDQVGEEHDVAVAFCRRGIPAVHVFQSEAAVLEHIETFVFTPPAESGGGGHRPDIVTMDGSGREMGELGDDLPLVIPVLRSLIQRTSREPSLLGRVIVARCPGESANRACASFQRAGMSVSRNEMQKFHPWPKQGRMTFWSA